MRSKPSSDSVSHPYQSSCPPQETRGPCSLCICYYLYPNNSHTLQCSPSLPNWALLPSCPFEYAHEFPSCTSDSTFPKAKLLSFSSQLLPTLNLEATPPLQFWALVNSRLVIFKHTEDIFDPHPHIHSVTKSSGAFPRPPIHSSCPFSYHSQLQSRRCSHELSLHLASLSWNPFHLPFHHAQKQILKFVLRIYTIGRTPFTSYLLRICCVPGPG